MKNPITYSVSQARQLRRKRQKRNFLIIGSVLGVLALSIFIVFVYNSRPDLAEPQITSETAGTSAEGFVEGTDSPESSGLVDSTAEATTETAPNPTEPVGSGATSPPMDTEPDILITKGNHLPERTHKERDSLFHDLILDLDKLVKESADARVGISYLNLTQNKESWGVHDTEPFVPAGIMSFPVCLVYYEQVKAGTLHPESTITLTGEDLMNGSTVFGEEDISQQVALKDAARYAVAKNDNASLQILIRAIGGIEAVMSRLTPISHVVSFTEDSEYLDFSETPRKGKYRISTRDFVFYMREFYHRYQYDPETYQPLLNDLVKANSAWGIGVVVPDSWISGTKTGQNFPTYGALSGISIVFAEEPYILCVMSDTKDIDAGKFLHEQISRKVSAYIHACYSPAPTPEPTSPTEPTDPTSPAG